MEKEIELARKYGFIPMESRDYVDRAMTHKRAIEAMAASAAKMELLTPEELLNQTIYTSRKMKVKKFYHTFELGERKVTLCLLVEEQKRTFIQHLNDLPAEANVNVGYSVCHPDDEFNEVLAKRISLGRAEKEKTCLKEVAYSFPVELAFDLGILKGLAHRAESLIKKGHITIKGIRDVEAV